MLPGVTRTTPTATATASSFFSSSSSSSSSVPSEHGSVYGYGGLSGLRFEDYFKPPRDRDREREKEREKR